MKTLRRKGLRFSVVFIFWFVFLDLIKSILVFFIHNRKQYTSKNILFIEPFQQGYGDLFFQTALFECLHCNGYVVDVAARENHKVILKNNPYVNRIIDWSFRDIGQFTKRDQIIIGLGRSTIREIVLLLAGSSEKIILDKDLNLWVQTFDQNSNTIAWQVLIRHFLEIDRVDYRPHLHFVKNNKKHSGIAIIAGIKDKTKNFCGLIKLAKIINRRVVLLGEGDFSIGDYSNIENKINKLSYEETVNRMSECEVVIGPEGSLIQIASSIVPKTIAIDPQGKFAKNAHPHFLLSTKIISSKDENNVISEIFRMV